jgi:adenine-specific DNA-methyltransferase
MHGHSSESRFIHVTREFVSSDYIAKIIKEVGEDQSVLIYGVSIQSGLRLPVNVEVKKIPKDLLKKCDFESEVR